MFYQNFIMHAYWYLMLLLLQQSTYVGRSDNLNRIDFSQCLNASYYIFSSIQIVKSCFV